MVNEILFAGGGLLLGSGISYILAKKLSSSSSQVLIEQAKAKARVIEHEAELRLHDTELKAK